MEPNAKPEDAPEAKDDKSGVTAAPGGAKKKVVVKPQQVPVITPWAFRETKLRENMVERITELKPEGNPDPVQLENIRKFVLAEIAALATDINVVEVSIETQIHPGCRQANVIIFPKKF